MVLVGGFSSPALAVKTKMTGVEYVCSKDNDFFAMNTKAKRIWIGKGVYQVGAEVEELQNVQATVQQSNRSVLSYSGESNLDFGNGQVVKLLFTGVLFVAKIPMENHVSLTLGGQTKTAVMFCNAK